MASPSPAQCARSWISLQHCPIEETFAHAPTRRELERRTYHRTDAKVERDYATSAELKLAGYEVLRFTWKQVVRRPDLVLALLRRVLA